MGKPDNITDVAKAERPTPPVPTHIDKNEGPGRVKAAWAKEYAGVGKQAVAIPGSASSVSISKIEVADNVVSVWTSEDTNLPPEYVIVNPPTAIYVDKNTSIEDPLGAIAHIINGAKK